VTGFTNLYCMEIDPNVQADDTPDELAAAGAAAGAASGGLTNADFSKLLREYGGQIPGIDELMSFAELMQQVQKLEFDVTVFDTAPTGHTLRLLSLPRMIDNLLVKLLGLRSTFGPLLTSMNTMMGAASSLPSEALIVGKLEELKKVIDAVNSRIHSADETTFVCVCIPEFLSLYETERLVQELVKHDIDTHNIVVNQVLFSCAVDATAAGGKGTLTCGRCNARSRMQAKYLEQIGELYGDMFHVIKTPLLNEEVRGGAKLTDFGSFLLSPYDPSVPLPATLADKA
jgi:arsenite-transporting ATPase